MYYGMFFFFFCTSVSNLCALGMSLAVNFLKPGVRG